MAINPQLLVGLIPLLQRALQHAQAPVPNVTNALESGYDTGIMNEMFQNLYNKQAMDGVDRYTGIDALNALNNEYGDRVTPPVESASSAAELFSRMLDAEDNANVVANNSIANTSNQDWLEDSSKDDLLDMVWKRNTGGPMYVNSNKYVYGSSILPEEQPVFKAPVGTVDFPVDDPNDWEIDPLTGKYKRKQGNI